MVVGDRWQRNLELEPSVCDDPMANSLCNVQIRHFSSVGKMSAVRPAMNDRSIGPRRHARRMMAIGCKSKLRFARFPTNDATVDFR
jgi:hypothetical protein